MSSVQGSISSNGSSYVIFEDSSGSINTEEIALGTFPTVIACFVAVFSVSCLIGVISAAVALGIVVGVAGICAALGLAVAWGIIFKVYLITALSIIGTSVLIGGTILSFVELHHQERV